MIALFTDFGFNGPYLGQIKAVLLDRSPKTPVIDLIADVPAYDVQAAAYLLAAVSAPLPPDTVFICVVDPGVGSERRPLAVSVDGRWFVGPDNGLFSIVTRGGGRVKWFEIEWRPDHLSHSFHGRDLFAPVAARLARSKKVAMRKIKPPAEYGGWSDDLPQVIYIDRYGNCVTGLRADRVDTQGQLVVNQTRIGYARTFSEVEAGTPFWYENSMGLVEIAVNRGSAATQLQLGIGAPVALSLDTL